mmetsp:Transcript_20860/g.30882  ORF Transcript_20860/g.30882 Transcript_20860/m.30882 type:complete len:304 (-) Transcript_20860:113-1024(-)|eukprot:CAMPEP_0194208832 /NCGR_PEP_ID=MMETSP0156-20130528/7166_1 /TAXON_ID=33649 /ORGANISM="Thalassionema nitzschioides, Strain L26-B" /LENGTH=303 /DNA_ID=CAMNT_0038935879 /DNA_START=89 /DNA_END=1000 /DNA_ORIENTATION=+
MSGKSVVAVLEHNPYTEGIEDVHSYKNQVKNSFMRLKELLHQAHKKVDGLKLDLVVFPERAGGLSQAMINWYAPVTEVPYTYAVQEGTTKRKIYDDAKSVYQWQLDFVAKEICQEFGCATVVSLFDTDRAKYHVSEEFRVYSQAVYFDNEGKIVTKYNKINPYFGFVDAGKPDQMAFAELEGERKVYLALGQDVVGLEHYPRAQIMEDVDRSGASPIVALPYDWPKGAGQAKAAGNMRQWATPLTWGADAGYNNLVVAASNQNGISIMVAEDGEVMWYDDEKSSKLAGGDVEYEESKMFWRTV